MADETNLKTLAVSNKEYQKILLQTADELRKEGLLCDVRILVEGQSFLAHRSILASASGYFRGLFTNDMKEKQMMECKLDELSSLVMEPLLCYIYTGNVTLTEENAENIVAASDYLIIQSLKDIGCQFLESLLSPSRCFGLRDFAEKYSCEALKSAATSYIVKHFTEACDTEAFKTIDYKVYVEIIARDDLEVSREEDVYETLITWVNHDLESRREHFEELFGKIRLTTMSKHYLVDQVESEELVSSSFHSTKLVLRALNSFVLHAYDEQEPARKNLERHLDVIAVCGGNLSKEATCYSPQRDKWLPLADMLRPRDEHCTAVHDNVLYSFGSTQPENGQSVEQYNAHTNTWLAVANMPQMRCAATAVTSGDHIFIIGGRIPNGGSTKQVMRYDADINKWFVETPMSYKRAGLCSAACRGFVYAIGGLSDRSEFLRTVERYNPRKKVWNDVSPTQVARYFACAVEMNGKIFVIGGQSSTGAYLSSCEAFDPETGNWASLPNFSIPRQAAGVTRLGNRIFLFGGCNNSGSLDSVECYDERKRRWETMTKMPCKRSWVQCGVLRVAKDLFPLN
ncbi:kelch-like protein 12 [Montipora capricornis]|uniref:kelch-like protein 12 n=1 Tax=Montipora capricornis TaxID=246305 RepID=UPI0035F214EC